MVNVFLSYNSADKDFARGVARTVAVTGNPDWFDEWKVLPGDSIPGSINKGLKTFDVFVLIWSRAASNSRWVNSEIEAAVARRIDDESIRLIPVVLDETPLPPILAPIRYIDGKFGDHLSVAREILNIDSESKFRIAIQSFIEEAGFEFCEYQGAGVYVACPNYGAEPQVLEGWQRTDHQRDDTYAGVRCTNCL